MNISAKQLYLWHILTNKRQKQTIGTESFEQMTFNPIGLPKKKYLWDIHPQFSRRPIFCNPFLEFSDFHLSIDEWHDVLRFVILFVDKESPFSYEKELAVRRRVCLDAIRPISKQTEIVIDEEGAEFKKLLYYFFKLINDLDYKLWWATLNSLDENYKFLAFAEKEKDIEKRMMVKATVSKGIEAETERLKKIESLLFVNERLKNAIKEQAEEEELTGYAEKHALTID